MSVKPMDSGLHIEGFSLFSKPDNAQHANCEELRSVSLEESAASRNFRNEFEMTCSKRRNRK